MVPGEGAYEFALRRQFEELSPAKCSPARREFVVGVAFRIEPETGWPRGCSARENTTHLEDDTSLVGRLFERRDDIESHGIFDSALV